MEEFDLYDDLISEKKSLDQAEEQKPEVDKLRKELKQSNEKLRTLRNKNFELKQKCDQLETNISSLIKTSRSEINRKNEIIASLRKELDDIKFRRILKQKQGSSSEIRELTQRLTDVLKNDSPSSKLSISDGVTNGVKPRNKSIKVTHFSSEDVYTIKLGNTSFTNVFNGDIKEAAVLTVEQKIPDCLVQEPKLNEKTDVPTAVPPPTSESMEEKNPQKNTKSEEKCDEYNKIKNRDQNRNCRDQSRSSRRSDRDRRHSGENKRHSRRSSSRSRKEGKSYSERHSYKTSSTSKANTKSNTDSKQDKIDIHSCKDRQAKKSSKSPKSYTSSSSSRTSNKTQSPRIATSKKNSQTSLELTEMETTDIDTLLEEKKRLLANLAQEKRSLLSEGEDEIIVKIDQKKKIISQNGASNCHPGSEREEGECEDDEVEDEIIGKMDHQKKTHSKNQTDSANCQQGAEKDIIDTTPNKNEDSIDGILSTNEFLGNWPATSFTQYKTPPSKNCRNRTDSETSSNVDFSSAAGKFHW